MNDTPIYEDLIKLVDQIQMVAPQQYEAFFTSNEWKYELKYHPERFYRSDEYDLMWLGAKVVVIGDDQSFWTLADKIIPKETTMTKENLTFYEPDEFQLAKFQRINSLSEDDWELRCVAWNDCSICPMAIHQYLLSTTTHHCTYGISEKEFRLWMSSADCVY